ncbi:MAG: ABC transporter permease [Acetobacteraceae bacterium]|nr:ABC transporter permease [Acetobacteraceae bacterium]
MTVAITTDTGRVTAIELRPDATFASRQSMALRDVREAIRLWPLCWKLSWLDIVLRYRGSTLGPFWLTLSTAVMVGALGFLNSVLFGMTLRAYLPYLALSLVLWGYVSTVVGEGCACFTGVTSTILSMRMPLSLQAMRIVVRNVLVLAHNIVVIVVVDLLLSSWPDWRGLYAIPALALWIVDGVAIAALLGAFCARFRDIPPIVASVMQMAFFLSAVIYKPEQLGTSIVLLLFDPFYTVLEVVRGPLVGHIPGHATYVSALVFSAGLCVVSWLVFVRVRERISYWL